MIHFAQRYATSASFKGQGDFQFVIIKSYQASYWTMVYVKYFSDGGTSYRWIYLIF